MSFSSAVLGQGRPLDHFNQHNPENHQHSQENHPATPRSPSRSFGASTLNTHSTTTTALTNHFDPDEPALARFARIKQREQQALNSRTNKSTSGVFTSPPKPEKWSVKDTSVNIATAFHQAANAYDMQPNDPNNSWASGRPISNVPRSTSVEYEKEAAARRHVALAAPKTAARRRPLSKTTSVRHVPDSEGEEEQDTLNGRAKSPFEHVLDVTKRAILPATFYLRQRSHEPDNSQSAANGNESSYDYAEEEAEYQNIINQAPSSRRGTTATHKRNRISIDNKAYRPSASDLDDDDDNLDDEGRRIRRRKKKKEPPGGPLTTLPVANYDKRKRRKSRGSKGNLGEMEDERSDSDDNAEEPPAQSAAAQRASVTRDRPPISVSRSSVPPQYGFYDQPEDPPDDIERGLESIPEVPEVQPPEQQPETIPSNDSQTKISIGALLGKCVRVLYLLGSFLVTAVLWIMGMLLFILGSVFGTMYDIVLSRPAAWLSGVRPGTFLQLGIYIFVAGAIYAAWFTLHEPLLQWVSPRPWISRPIRYEAPNIPPANLAELTARLQTIEIALSGLVQEQDKAQNRLESEVQGRAELGGRVGSIEVRLLQERQRLAEAEAQVQQLVKQGLPNLKEELEALLSQVHVLEYREAGGSDEESIARVKALEARVDGVEGGLKEALEVGRSAVKTVGTTSGVAAAWWNKLATGNTGLTIKSTDGQDVTALIGRLVDTAVSKYSKDVIARPDFALHSSGARIIPSLTSPTFESSPSTLPGQIVGLLTGNGYTIGRPPVTALHHELHSGHCWPFAGSRGQLGVVLAAPTYISDVTIDHVAMEVAIDMRQSAPREMELWGLVEGRDNIERVRKWQAEKARRRSEDDGSPRSVEDEEPEYPRTLPISPQYFRIASFSYEIHSSDNIQTFPVSQEIRDLEVDFGIVVLMVKSNWGRKDFTCLYRLRVHGQRLGEDQSLAVGEA